MSWIRNTQEAGDRRPIDIWRLGFCGLTVVLLGVWAQSQSTINVDLFTPINGPGDDTVVLVARATMYLGAALPSVLLGGVLLAMTTAAAVRVAFGSPAGKPTVDEVRAALTDLGYDVTAIRPATEAIRLATVMDVELASG